MNKYRMIKTLFSMIISVVIYIMGSLMVFRIERVELGFIPFILLMLISILMQFLESRNLSSKVIFFSLLIFNFGATFLLYGKDSFVLQGILGLGAIFLLPKYSMDSVNYDYYRAKIKGITILLLITIIFYFGMTKEYSLYLFRFYIIYFALTIGLLREARNFNYKIKIKNENLYNILTLSFIFVLSTDMVFNVVKRAFYIFREIFNKIVYFIVYVVFKILEKPLNAFFAFMAKLWAKVFSQDQRIEIQPQENLPQEVEVITGKNLDLAANVVKILLVLTVIYIGYRVLKGYRYKKAIKEEGVEEFREKIERSNKSLRKKIAASIKNLFATKDNRSQVLNIYKHFLSKSLIKGFFKRYMTATQLRNIVKIKINEEESLGNLTNIYNEAKFSSRTITDEQVSRVKESYESIKNKI